MELAAYIYDALAYEQAHNAQLAIEQYSVLANCDLPIRLSHRRWQTCLLSAIAVTSFSGLNLSGVQFAQAATSLEPSVNSAPWCNNLYLCNTDYVLEVQSLLTQQGFSVGAIDGVYGTQTKQAVIEFQKRHNTLVVDGIPGEKTLTLLRNAAKQSDPLQTSPKSKQSARGRLNNSNYSIYPRNKTPLIAKQNGSSEEIGNLQILLKQRGFYQGEVDGRVGEETTQAIQKAQQAYGLNPDGFAGPWTIRALLAGGSDQALTQPSIDLVPQSDDIKRLQEVLYARGFYDGEINGNYDAHTRDSIFKAQIAYGLPITGENDAILIQRMNSQNRTRNDVQNIRNSPNSQDIRPSPRNSPTNVQAFNPM